MEHDKTDIWVYAHWVGMSEPKYIGILSYTHIKGRKYFSFEYEPQWLKSKKLILLDPDLGWYHGPQFPNKKENFGVFLDSMPDTWGRTLMKRRASIKSKEEKETIPNLKDIDFLLGVYDECRMGALRYKLDPNGPFLDNNQEFPTPPWVRIRDLQYGVELLESNKDNEDVKQWLSLLFTQGSSLGGARPKSNILDTDNQLWIAKFPSNNDTIDKALWEYLAYKLAIKAKINMAESKIQHIAGHFYTFFTKRFDRIMNERIHFASAMTMTGNNEENIKDKRPSYLEIAEFIQFSGINITENLHQLWRRIVFNIAVSNTDDHLRNHGFLLTDAGWELSPAYDINPSTDRNMLALNIDLEDNSLDFELAKSVGKYFQLNKAEMDIIINEIIAIVKNWKYIANDIGISRKEQELMEPAFHY